MIYVIDTHALYWFLQGSRKLSRRARAIIDDARSGNAYLFLSVVSLAELQMVLEKNQDPRPLQAWIAPVLHSSYLEIVPLELEHIRKSSELRRLPDMHDRLIVATALLKDVPLITTDEKIEDSKLVETVW